MPPLPPVVFQHFRRPRNEGPLAPCDAVGRIEGRREGSWIELYLRLEAEPERRVAASYVFHGDRSSVAGLSLLTSVIAGWPLIDVERLTLDALGSSVELGREHLPMLVPAHDALRAALADLKGEPNPCAHEGELICHCLHVRRGRIERVIREQQLDSVEGVRRWTRACSGCRSCRPDIERLLACRERPPGPRNGGHPAEGRADPPPP